MNISVVIVFFSIISFFFLLLFSTFFPFFFYFIRVLYAINISVCEFYVYNRKRKLFFLIWNKNYTVFRCFEYCRHKVREKKNFFIVKSQECSPITFPQSFIDWLLNCIRLYTRYNNCYQYRKNDSLNLLQQNFLLLRNCLRIL